MRKATLFEPNHTLISISLHPAQYNPIPGSGGQSYHQSIAAGSNRRFDTYHALKRRNSIEPSLERTLNAAPIESVAARELEETIESHHAQGSPHPEPPSSSSVADFLYDPS